MEEYQDIKELLKPRRTISASPQLRQRVGKALAQKHSSARWLWKAAACAALMVGGTMLFYSRTSTDTDCIVYVAGQQASGDEARAIAEADVAKMEQFMLTVAQQNAAEQEKVSQFMQHKSQPK
ncbi:MAG: hypothetical protein IKQ89_04500 [Muribaculaceae bacterium]|nr:hypothetical protein [Muribaculaceae bacterium]